MDRQQQLDASLIQTFTRIFVLVIIFALIAIAINKMTKNFQLFHNENIKQEAQRLKQVIHILHNQWLIKGRPNALKAQWEPLPTSLSEIKATKPFDFTHLKFGVTGFPVPKVEDAQGCSELWQALMAADAQLLNVKAEYQPQDKSCHYNQIAQPQESIPLGAIKYQFENGNVEYLVPVSE